MILDLSGRVKDLTLLKGEPRHTDLSLIRSQGLLQVDGCYVREPVRG